MLSGLLAFGLAALAVGAFIDDTEQRIQGKLDDERYAANRKAVEKMAPIPGRVVTLKRANDADKVYVESELCDAASFAAHRCDVNGMVGSVLNWRTYSSR